MRTRFDMAVGTLLVCFFCSFVMLYAKADEKLILRVPEDAKIYIKGTPISEERLLARNSFSGRIHELAAALMGKPYVYKEYRISQEELADSKVYDWMVKEIPYQEVQTGILDYTLPSEAFCEAVEGIIEGAAIAYYNRVSGFSGNFAEYYRSGTNAYERIVMSDSATKWGRFIAPAKVENVECTDIFAYSDNVFSATATIESEAAYGYQEHFAIHLLFQNDEKGWHVTDFTFMP